MERTRARLFSGLISWGSAILLNMEKMRTEGIVIRAIPFKDYDAIVTVFTPKAGLLKIVVKGAYSSKKGKGSCTDPLSLIEVIYTQGQSDLCLCHDIAVLNSFSHLRQNLSVLEAACEMLKAIEATQLPGKIVPELYQLFGVYLKRLPESSDPSCLGASFHLKTLRHEGLLGSSDLFKMNEEERQLVEVLTLCRDFSLLAKLTIAPALAVQIKQFFYLSI